MQPMDQIEKLSASSNDDDNVRAMIEECNELIDQYNRQASEQTVPDVQLQDLRAKVITFKKRIEKVRRGY